MNQQEFSKIKLGDEIDLSDYDFLAQKPFIVRGFAYEFQACPPIKQKNNIGIPNECATVCVLLKPSSYKSITDFLPPRFHDFYNHENLVPIGWGHISRVVLASPIISRSKCLTVINSHRSKLAQRPLIATDWTDEDLKLECERLGLKV